MSPGNIARLALLAVSLAGAAEAAAESPQIPDDTRIADRRQALQAIVDRADAAGLPADVIAAKIREGLAKGAPPDAIQAVADRLAADLASAQTFVATRRNGASPPSLVRAVAEAMTAGVPPQGLDALVRGTSAPPAGTVRAVEVLVDLTMRGYPSARAALLVNQVLAREPASLARLIAGVETIRRDQAASPIEALDALSRGIAGGGSFDAAVARAVEEVRSGSGSAGKTHGKSDLEHGSKGGPRRGKPGK